MELNDAAVGAALAAFGKNLPTNPAEVTGAVWMVALNDALRAYEAARPSDLPGDLPDHIALQVGQVYEGTMDNREGSAAAMSKAYRHMRRLLKMDAVVRERIAKMTRRDPL